MSEQAESLLAELLTEQRQTNQLLMMLIEAMAEDQENPDAEPRVYMDGSRIE